ncbi:sodium channel and clathrin linker 1 isoform X3 [Lemur catta]|uniref:sodium channel and clathrin linker 1 isoform X3 n=1 Tax=Lemur catta TaxID=9447 RepID=UPI001E269E81|nr:sodium channel and clathrin linker 1 isoform X3 [Lemur catta]
MAREIDVLREQNRKLYEALRWYENENFLKYSVVQKAVFKGDGDDILGNSVAAQSCLAPLITEYEKHLEVLNGQLKYYQKQMGEMKLQLENVIKENERLHSELKDVVEKQLEALPLGTEIGTDIYTEDETVKNLQEQLQLANQEKTRAVELWQIVSQELDSVQKLYQEHMTEAQIRVLESQKHKDQLTNYKQLTKQLHISKENTQMANQHILKIITEQSVQIEQLRKQLRQAKLDVRVAAAKVEELTKAAEDLRGQMQKKEEDMVSAQGREEASDRRLQQLQTSIKQLETRLCVVIQEANQLRAEKNNLEKQTRDLQAKCNELENEKYEAIIRARNSMQLLEEANLQKNQALLEEKQKEEHIKKMKETVSQILQDAAVRTRKEITNTKKQYNIQISRLSEELSALQMECAERQGQIERTIKEKKAVEEELEKISAMEHEFSIKEHGYEVQLREMEDSNRNSTVELRHLLATQQKAANRWKEETKKLTESAEIRISNLKSELSRQKLHTQELLSQLEMANEKVVENEKLILEHQEKANRLQRRLSQAEERAASASQQLSVITVQRRKAASMMNLESI